MYNNSDILEKSEINQEYERIQIVDTAWAHNISTVILRKYRDTQQERL